MSSDHPKTIDELAARRRVRHSRPKDIPLNSIDPLEGMNEFEKRKSFNEFKRETLEKKPWYVLPDTLSKSKGDMEVLDDELERNYASFAVNIDFDLYPFAYGKTQEMEFLHQQWREAKSEALKMQLQTKILRAVKETMKASFQESPPKH